MGERRGIDHLYDGYSLSVLRDSVKDGSVDLIYQDPPFNSTPVTTGCSGRRWGRGVAQIGAFDGTGHWNDGA